MKTHADRGSKVLSPLLRKHVHSLMNKQKIGELRVSHVDGGRGGERFIVTEKYGTHWNMVGKISLSDKPPYLGFLDISKIIRLR